MQTKSENKNDNKSQSASGSVAENFDHSEQVIPFIDNRPEALAQRKLQTSANNASSSDQLKPNENYPVQRVGTDKDTKGRLWGTKQRHLIGPWKIQTMANYWAFVKTKLDPFYAKVGTTQLAFAGVLNHMVQADAANCHGELDALRTSAPVVVGSPAIRDGTDVRMLADIKRRLNWFVVNKAAHWENAINTQLDIKKNALTPADKWQIYGEALLAESTGQAPTARWNYNASVVANQIKVQALLVTTILNAWLDNVDTRRGRIIGHWDTAKAAIVGTQGSLPQATVQALFEGYAGRMTRELLVAAMDNQITRRQWGGVKRLNGHNTYAKELKIRAMGGDDRVFSRKNTPGVLNVIGSDH